MALTLFGTGQTDPRDLDDLDANFTEIDSRIDALEAGGSGVLAGTVIVDTVSALRALASGATADATHALTRGYYTAGDGGAAEYIKDAGDTSTADNSGTVIVSTGGRCWKLKVVGPTVSSRQLGVRGDGTTNESAALMAADGWARDLKKTLYIEGIVLLNTQIEVSNPTSWQFAGHNGSGGSDLMIPSSYLTTTATHPTGQAAVVVSTDGIQFHGGGIITHASFGYDGLVVAGYGFRWTGSPYFGRAGRDGCRIGADAGADVNANAVFLDCPVFAYNGRHGLNIDDVGGDSGGVNANTFMINKPFSHHNEGHGIRLGRTYLGGTIISPLCERNAVGLYFEPDATGISIVGGDMEDNTTPAGGGALQNVVYATGYAQFLNVMLGTVIQGVPVVRPMAISGDYLPQPYGASTAGTLTYTARTGRYTVSNGILMVQIYVKWSGASGISGQMYCTLPDILPGVNIITSCQTAPAYIAATVVSEGCAVSSGTTLVALVDTAISPPRLQFYVQSLGAISAYAIPSSGGFVVNAAIPLLAF